MPGIAAIVTKMRREDAEAQLQAMLGVMRHESFYAVRTWVDAELGVYVGWTARVGSFSDADAQQSERGDVTMVFSGEEYAPDGIATALKTRGHHVGRDASSYLVHLYEDDPRFAASLNGLFHGVVVDRRRGAIAFFNDRYGMHRLYYHEAKDAVYLAAEAKAILAVRPELRRIDQRGLGESLTLGCVVENRTLFADLQVLPGASWWEFDRAHRCRKTAFFDAREWEQQPRLTTDGFYTKLRDVFARNLPRYFRGPERIGMSLTGGLDSRMIMAWQTCAPGTLPTYTWAGPYRDCQDVLIAREVASICGQPHEAIVMGKELLSRFAYFANRAVFLSDGAVDVSLAPDVFMNIRAREIAPVRMTGLYGGEVLRRVRMFKPVLPMNGLFQPDLLPQFDQAQRTYDDVIDAHPLSFAVFRQAPWHHYNSLSLEETQISMRPLFLDNDFVQTVFQAPDSACTSNDVSLRLIADGNPALSRVPTDRGVGGRARPIEALAHAYQEFTFKAEYAYDYGMPQWLARLDGRFKALRLERLFLGRHKPLHFRLWYRNELAGYVREMLLDRRSLSRAYVNRAAVERMVTAHVTATGNYTTEIHRLLKLELLHRNFIDGDGLRAHQQQPVAAVGLV